MKKIIRLSVCTLSILVAMNIVINPTISAFAQEFNHVACNEISCSSDGNDSGIQRAPTVCGSSTYHKMMTNGFGTVYLPNGAKYIHLGQLWQCSNPNCHLVMVTVGGIVLNQMMPIGKWAISNEYPYDVPLTGTIIYNPLAYGESSSTTMAGYKFFAS